MVSDALNQPAFDSVWNLSHFGDKWPLLDWRARDARADGVKSVAMGQVIQINEAALSTRGLKIPTAI